MHALADRVEDQIALPAQAEQRCFRALLLGEVADEGAEDPGVVETNGGYGQLDRQLVSIAVQSGQFDALVDDGPVAAGGKGSQPALVGFAMAQRNDGLGHRSADDLRARPPEGPLRLGIPLDDAAVGVGDDNRIQRMLNDEPSVLESLQLRLIEAGPKTNARNHLIDGSFFKPPLSV